MFPADLEYVVLRATTFLVLLLALACATDRGLGQDGLSQHKNDNRQHHSWARFGVRSWKRVRVLSETLDGNGTIETTTSEERKTTLMQVDETRYTIKVETTVEVAGKQLRGGPRYITRGYHGEVNGQKAKIEELGFREVMICGKPYRSRVKRIVIDDSRTKLVSEVYYAADRSPHVLRRETKGTAGKANRFESLVQVVAVDRSSHVLGQTMLASHVKTVNRLANGETTETLEVQCEDIPGAVVSYRQETLDESGRVIQRRTLELLGYEALGVPHQVLSPKRPRGRGLRRFFGPRPHW